jgi:hypothetical protein
MNLCFFVMLGTIEFLLPVPISEESSIAGGNVLCPFFGSCTDSPTMITWANVKLLIIANIKTHTQGSRAQ